MRWDAGGAAGVVESSVTDVGAAAGFGAGGFVAGPFGRDEAAGWDPAVMIGRGAVASPPPPAVAAMAACCA
ncbi:MAG: hypothetical protein WDN49_20810 [Acetobacteraceae bacterium]